MAGVAGVKRKKPSVPLDTSLCNRGVWLVKVPNYLSNAWNESEKGTIVGKMKIRTEAGLPKVEFALSPELVKVKLDGKNELELPQKHRVSMLETSSQCLCTFSEDTVLGKLAAEGKVIQRADIQPVASASYMALKKHQIKQAEKTKFTAQHLKQIPNTVYRPKAVHKELVDRTKKNELKKTRSEKEVVLDLLFSAFQHEQFYSSKNLIEITQQPEGYLKEILREVCVYHTKAPHKFMWALKPEYKMNTDAEQSSDK